MSKDVHTEYFNARLKPVTKANHAKIYITKKFDGIYIGEAVVDNATLKTVCVERGNHEKVLHALEAWVKLSENTGNAKLYNLYDEETTEFADALIMVVSAGGTSEVWARDDFNGEWLRRIVGSLEQIEAYHKELADQICDKSGTRKTRKAADKSRYVRNEVNGYAERDSDLLVEKASCVMLFDDNGDLCNTGDARRIYCDRHGRWVIQRRRPEDGQYVRVLNTYTQFRWAYKAMLKAIGLDKESIQKRADAICAIKAAFDKRGIYGQTKLEDKQQEKSGLATEAVANTQEEADEGQGSLDDGTQDSVKPAEISEQSIKEAEESVTTGAESAEAEADNTAEEAEAATEEVNDTEEAETVTEEADTESNEVTDEPMADAGDAYDEYELPKIYPKLRGAYTVVDRVLERLNYREDWDYNKVEEYLRACVIRTRKSGGSRWINTGLLGVTGEFIMVADTGKSGYEVDSLKICDSIGQAQQLIPGFKSNKTPSVIQWSSDISEYVWDPKTSVAPIGLDTARHIINERLSRLPDVMQKAKAEDILVMLHNCIESETKRACADVTYALPSYSCSHDKLSMLLPLRIPFVEGNRPLAGMALAKNKSKYYLTSVITLDMVKRTLTLFRRDPGTTWLAEVG